ncbi:tRNA-uridine aminocarboxypropyltransferase [Geotalea sp. SG265]|uniref:tRNA-uridine aminocarboxypropyltransferase n=1 Tax=Geotalea sp. SG265 TaxID=2922867 RepID=UPI001FAFFF4E
MGNRSKRAERCRHCRMHNHLCICHLISHYELATRLVLVMHHREVVKTTATGPLALLALKNSELRIHGRRDQPLDCSDLMVPERRTLILYPGEDVPVLDATLLAQDCRPITLVVPDGNWRQASRMGRRLPGLEKAARVRLPAGRPSEWGVRREHHEEGLATFEAIARAMGIVESRTVQEGMEKLFRQMVRRTLIAKGAGGRAPLPDEGRADEIPRQ